MRLVYTNEQQTYPVGQEVKVGDQVQRKDNLAMYYEVVSFRKPHKPSSQGKVYVKVYEENIGLYSIEYYVSVIGAEWIEREDRESLPDIQEE